MGSLSRNKLCPPFGVMLIITLDFDFSVHPVFQNGSSLTERDAAGGEAARRIGDGRDQTSEALFDRYRIQISAVTKVHYKSFCSNQAISVP
jgi:hypothetical protein